MARNSTGTFTLSDTVTTGTTADAPEVNAILTDLGTEMTDSLSRSGKGPMLTGLKAFAGTVLLPGYTFDGDTNSGFYSIGADSIGLSLGGALVLTYAAAGTTIAAAQVWAFPASGLTIGGAAPYAVGGTDVAVADGGTGSSTAAGAATNLGLGTGDSPQFTAVNIGAAADTTLARASAGRAMVEGSNVLMASDIAAQSDQETGTSTALLVTPGRQHFHPGHPKCWAYITLSGSTPTLAASYNITSITDTAVGRVTITIATDFSSANWAPVPGVGFGGNCLVTFTNVLAGSVELRTIDVVNSATADPDAYSLVGYGDQA